MKQNGRHATIDRTVEGYGDLAGAVYRALQSRPDRGRPWWGDEITVITPLFKTAFDVSPDDGSVTLVKRCRPA